MIAFVVNPASGGGQLGKLWPRVESEVAARFPGGYTVSFTQNKMDAADLTRRKLKEGAEIVVAAGGDGTLNEAANGFFEDGAPIRPDAALAVLSFGTGADFIRTIRWPRDYKAALDRLAKKETMPIDLIEAQFFDLSGQEVRRRYINITDFGCGGAVVERVNRLSKRWGGKISFLWGIASTLLVYRNQEIRLSFDGGPWERGVFNNCIAANGAFFGSGLNPAPGAKLDDGLLDFVSIGDVTLLESLLNFPKFQKGTHLSHPKIRHRQVRKLRAESDDRVLIDMDGEMVGRLPLSLEVVPLAIRVCV